MPIGKWRKRQAHEAAGRSRRRLLTEEERAAIRQTAVKLYGADGFYRCPTTGQVIEALPGDDKAICGCGRSNPRCPEERTERTRTHKRRFLVSASVDDWIDQRGGL